MQTAETLYQAEQKQVDTDHHTPTAGAMTGHILSNLHIQQNKLNQARFALKGDAKVFADGEITAMYHRERALFDELNQLMLDEGETIPTTTQEFLDYTFLSEQGQLKFESTATILFEIVKDCDAQLMFVTRGIALADKESKFALAAFLRQLDGWLKHQMRQIQAYLGHSVREGLDEEDDDE
ncbi:ferritin family protein [Lacticaseibacillus saniviri]|uniref:DNA-binding ferritin family protein (Oxidative damage protectant) n=1 Tax=Lacticaseibacillus saniviri JCM 17471 = DSM 24301 TaxID=1293598 RepID=A0A0R2N0Z5_9LACO|nr:hypothetical protein [Lacticaseibacillus saniviri]KRO18434.1 DNA-binding ferritin family protein (oxidative damage protectant) [Lacticaseibacillus saniviri JCM 17471 = DSM 24301]MCG4282932.1 DNA-binding protein [Lacticaseibacillus saniviri]